MSSSTSPRPTSLAFFADKYKVKYFLISYVDLFGMVRSKLVPAKAISAMQKTGAGFAGFSTYLDLTPAHPDMFAIPDPSSVVRLPWKPEVAWVAADLYMGGTPLPQAPRNVLKAQIASAKKQGYQMKTGVECEFFLLQGSGDARVAVSDPLDTADKPCYDQGALMRRYDIIAEICDHMEQLGWRPYQNDHEDANGQYEMNWEYDDCLVTADRHVFFKFMAKSVAEKHGMRATFMPKPFSDKTGNGAHCHVSVWDEFGKNLFHDDKGELGLSSMAYHFLGGVLQHAQALCAITNPTVNSYKRIDGTATASGSSWAPCSISYSGNNRTHMLRIPEAGRFEFRLADGAANPYLLQACLLGGGRRAAVRCDTIPQNADALARHVPTLVNFSLVYWHKRVKEPTRQAKCLLQLAADVSSLERAARRILKRWRESTSVAYICPHEASACVVRELTAMAAAGALPLLTGGAAAGMDGVKSGISPGARTDWNGHLPGLNKDLPVLPENLLDALRALSQSQAMKEALGADFVEAYVKLRTDQWREYTRHLSQWELDSTLDC